ncbi:MAG: carboxypeptidase-like regulatory domain-containing protein, partial [Bryobacterales bacterium]|nr:carboxypeptidase-like regulatory domain-containing protein [Bryobacterales bacterium]
MHLRTVNLLGLISLLLFGLHANVQAQSSVYGSLSGRTLDPSNAAVVGATLSLTESETGLEREASSGESGLYVFSRLRPGRYALSASKKGFRSTTITDIEIPVNAAPVLDVPLELGQISETVEVRAASLPVQAEGAQLSLLLNSDRIEDLPLNGKDFADLLLLSPGFGALGAGQMSASISGARGRFNSFGLDGMTNSDERTGGGGALNGGAANLTNTAPNVVSTEAIREFRVISTNADATFGRGSGGQ